jgi:hypothetical protein
MTLLPDRPESLFELTERMARGLAEKDEVSLTAAVQLLRKLDTAMDAYNRYFRKEAQLRLLICEIAASTAHVDL